MTNRDYAHIAHIVDNSGSMGMLAEVGSTVTRAENASKGINDFNKKQAEDSCGKTTVSLYSFSTIVNKTPVWDFMGIDDVRVKGYTIRPNGWTALYDAIGHVIHETGQRLEAMPEEERPGAVYVVISTDGDENYSVEYRGTEGLDRLKKMIKTQQDDYGWHFAYMGAELDAFGAAEKVGIYTQGSMSNAGNAYDVAYAATSDMITRNRGGQSFSYTKGERDKAKGKK